MDTVQTAVNRLLCVFDPRPHRKGLGSHINPLFYKHFKGVPCAVTNRKNKSAYPYLLTVDRYAFKPSVLNGNILDPRAEAYLSPKADHFLSDITHDLSQPVRADMRLCLNEYLLRRTHLNEPCGNESAKRVFYSCSKLSVRKCACAALSELNIAFLGEFSSAPELRNRLRSAVNVSPSFKNDRTIAAFRKHQSRKHSRWSEACNGNTALRSDTALCTGDKFRYINKSAVIPFQAQPPFLLRALKLSPHRGNHPYIVLLSCVKGDFMYSRPYRRAL